MSTPEEDINWLREDIAIDEGLRGSSDFSDFHETRIAENIVALRDLLDAYPQYKTPEDEEILNE